MYKNYLQLIRSQKGFALLYSVLVISLMLTIAVSISNTTYRQALLSSLAKDSQIAFYQADSGIECALYYDVTLLGFPYGFPPTNASLVCQTGTLNYSAGESSPNYHVFRWNNQSSTSPCFDVVIDKPNANQTYVRSYGHNVCASGPRKVERAIEIRY